MNKFCFVFLCLLSLSAFSQEDAWVYFNDKPNSQFYFNNPLQMLSQRSLDRRTNQNIALDSKDIPIHEPYVTQIANTAGIIVKSKSKWLNAVHVRGTVSAIQNLTSLSFVQRVRFANRVLNVAGRSSENQPAKIFHIINKHLDNATIFDYGNSSNQVQMLNVHLLHQANYTGAGKIIAVLDSGFSAVNTVLPFQRMFTNDLYLGGYNYVGGNTDVFSTHNHGTLTLSCMSGFVTGELVGTAPDAQYYLFITEDVAEENPVEESYWVAAAEEADRLGADIISTSLGYFGYDNPSYSHLYADMTGNTAFASQGANIAFSRGMIVVASAGNSGNSSEPHIGVPAEALNVLAVGAVKFDETFATFSSIGPSFDGRVKPDVMAKGQSTTVANTNGDTVAASGTSFSCPLISGAIASLWQAIPWATNQQVVNFVKQSSDRSASPTNQFGYGIPDFHLAFTLAENSAAINSKGKFIIYPNPTTDYFSVSFPIGVQNASLTLYNSLGQIVSENEVNPSNSIFMENLSAGIYFYKIESTIIKQSGKIIKN